MDLMKKKVTLYTYFNRNYHFLQIKMAIINIFYYLKYKKKVFLLLEICKILSREF